MVGNEDKGRETFPDTGWKWAQGTAEFLYQVRDWSLSKTILLLVSSTFNPVLTEH